jgi:hypothetical protein
MYNKSNIENQPMGLIQIESNIEKLQWIFLIPPNLLGQLVIDLSLLQILSLHWDPQGYI